MSIKQNKENKDANLNKKKIAQDRVIQQNEKKKKSDVEGLDKGFITKWVM